MITSKQISDENPHVNFTKLNKLFRERFGGRNQIQRVEAFPEYIQVIFSSRAGGQKEFSHFLETRLDRKTKTFSPESYWHEIQI